ncbi:hypothetical protein KP509_27G056400 [Ceratopteris richardii]|uniref:Uncharacterized protein n=1 Tax=Ceratopteris richardii TaxID=49495 RepID=A0A8T2RID4_CERRI|nr:hypothetical protein KP509_27G056400 [Ceratopteris richardii]KAH7295594.1 hypothetical protein KP509_27G056400 [Ceratopteris richardii]
MKHSASFRLFALLFVFYIESSSCSRPCPLPSVPSPPLLSNIAISSAVLFPSFDPRILNYTASVSSKISSVQFTVTLTHVEGHGVVRHNISLGDYESTVILSVVLDVYGYISPTYTFSFTRGSVKSVHFYLRKKDGHRIRFASEHLEVKNIYKYQLPRAILAEEHGHQENCC